MNTKKCFYKRNDLIDKKIEFDQILNTEVKVDMYLHDLIENTA